MFHPATPANPNITRNTPVWQCGRFDLPLDAPKIMGIVNMTPDSFSDGGTYGQSAAQALRHAETLLKDGADILDIGGESSRSGASFVPPEAEWARVAPVLRELAAWQVPLTLDTRRTWVMRQALDAGVVDGINDIQALEDDGAVALLAQAERIGVCLMHMKGLPENMQHNPQYGDVAAEVGAYLRSRVAACTAAGIAKARLTVDPGFGFGKTLQHNLDLMRDFARWAEAAQCPVLIGVSRKSMIGELTGRSEPKERALGSAVAAVAAVARGTAVVRVHDVRETREALAVWRALGTTSEVLTFSGRAAG